MNNHPKTLKSNIIKSQKPPFYLLKKFISEIKKGQAIDIGAGNGHNSIFLAQNGFKVEAIDTDSLKIEALKNATEKSKLKIDTQNIDVRKFDFSKKQYNLILAIQSLIFIRKIIKSCHEKTYAS